MEWYGVYDGVSCCRIEAHTPRQAAIKYAEKRHGTLDTMRDELVLVVIRERDGLRCSALLQPKVLVQWTAPRVEEVRG